MIDALIDSETYDSDVNLMQDIFVLFVAGLDSIRNETVSSIYHLTANKHSLHKFKEEMDVHIFSKGGNKD
jgi:cytochrome P450